MNYNYSSSINIFGILYFKFYLDIIIKDYINRYYKYNLITNKDI